MDIKFEKAKVVIFLTIGKGIYPIKRILIDLPLFKGGLFLFEKKVMQIYLFKIFCLAKILNSILVS